MVTMLIAGAIYILVNDEMLQNEELFALDILRDTPLFLVFLIVILVMIGLILILRVVNSSTS